MYMHMFYKHAFANSVHNLYKAKVTCQLHRHVVYLHSFGDQEGKFIEPSIFDMVDIVKSLLG